MFTGNIYNHYRTNVVHVLFVFLFPDPVSAPVVSCVNVSEDSCSLQCSVTKTEQTTLLWFRGEYPVNSSNSGVLPLTVQHQDYNSEYKCVAQNPAQNKTTTVNIITVCNISETQSGENPSEMTKTCKFSDTERMICLFLLIISFFL